jgi:hypothetical protein
MKIINKLHVMWHVLRGKPVMYRMFSKPITLHQGAILVECTFCRSEKELKNLKGKLK